MFADLDRRHRWASPWPKVSRSAHWAGIYTEVLVRCISCGAEEWIDDPTPIKRWIDSMWARAARPSAFARFLSPAPAGRVRVVGGDLVTFTRYQTLAMPAD